MDETPNNQRALISAKVPPSIKAAIERLAENDRRTVSGYLENLLIDHPIIRAEVERAEAATV